MLKMVMALAILWLVLGASGALLVDRQRAVTISDVALGPITLGRELQDQ